MATIDYLIRGQLSEYRPCYVDGRKALFHRWKDVDQVYTKILTAIRDSDIQRFKDMIDIHHVVKHNTELITAHNVVAIVEFEDGTIEDVEGKDIRFIDGSEMFEGIAWDDEGGESIGRGNLERHISC